VEAVWNTIGVLVLLGRVYQRNILIKFSSEDGRKVILQSQRKKKFSQHYLSQLTLLLLPISADIFKIP